MSEKSRTLSSTGYAYMQKNKRKESGEKSEPLYSTEDLIERYQISRSTIHNWVKEKILPPPIKMGRRTLWRLSELVEFERKAQHLKPRESP